MSAGTLPVSGLSAPVRPDWLALRVEEAINPEVPIVDAHHHLWDRPGDRYLLDDYAADAARGHRIVASVYVDCRSMYRRSGPVGWRSLGEVEFAAGMAAIGASGYYGDPLFCAGIVGNVDLRGGDAVVPVLHAMSRAGSGRFRGIRQVSSWDADERVTRPVPGRVPGLLADADFLAGFAALAPAGLRFDAFVFHPQLPEVADLAAAFPDTTIILDHCGGPLGLGRYADCRDGSFAEWRCGMTQVAAQPNVSVKLSGLGMRMQGFDFHERALPPTSQDLAEAWRPYIEFCIETFGIGRCMFASNFSPDKGSCSFVSLWNAFKRLSEGASNSERDALFRGTAARIYGLELDGPSPPTEPRADDGGIARG
jgi:L-fuconolactonase